MSSTTWLNIFDVTDFRKIADVRDKVSTALQSQYAHSQRYRNMGTVLNENIDMSTDIDNAYTEIMNPQTAKGVFLDWWGYRVGVNRYVTINGTPVRLDDDYFRFLLFYRALSNISDTTAYTVNNLLSMLTNSDVVIQDNGDMTFNLIVYGDLTEFEKTIIKRYGLLNRPAGVMYNKTTIYPDAEKQFGFFGSGLHPFNQAPFNNSYEV